MQRFVPAIFALLAGACGQSEQRGASTDDTEALPPKGDPHVTLLGASAYRVCADGTSGVVVAGSADNGVSVARLDATGSVAWSLAFETGTQAAFSGLGGMTLDALGNVYLTGGFDGTLKVGSLLLASSVNPGAQGEFFDPHGRASGDAFLLKLGRNGEPLWLKGVGGVAEQRGLGVAYAPDGSLALALAFAGRIELGTHSYLSSGGAERSDFLLARLDPDGNPLSARSFALQTTALTDVQFDHAGALLVANAGPFGGDSELGTLPAAGWVAKFDASFTPLWVVSTDPLQGPGVTGIALDSQDNVLVCTEGYDSDRLFGVDATDAGIRFAKLDPDGKLLFVRAFGTDRLDYASSISVLSDDGVAILGSFHTTVDFGGGKLVADESEAYKGETFVARFDADGSYVAALDARSPGEDYPQDMAALPNDNLVITGSSSTGPGLGNAPRQGTGYTFVAWLGSLL